MHRELRSTVKVGLNPVYIHNLKVIPPVLHFATHDHANRELEMETFSGRRQLQPDVIMTP